MAPGVTKILLCGQTTSRGKLVGRTKTMVSGGSLVRKDVPPYTKAAKEPLSYVGINSIGLRRRGFSTEKISEIQNIYRILYQKN